MDSTITESRAVLTTHSRSFRLAGRFLTSRQLDEAAVVYAFCRMVDDAADEADSVQIATEDLDAIEASLRGDAPADSTIAAFRDICHRRDIPMLAALELIAGVRSDLGVVRIADDAALTRYSYRVAGTVGVMMCGVLGVGARHAWPAAIALGIGMQITNICRDVVEDAARGRVYLPLDRLQAVGITDQSLINGSCSSTSLASVVSDLLDIADENYAFAESGMSHIPWRGRLGILIASRLYRAIGVRLRAVYGCDPTHGRTVTTPFEKARAVFSGLVRFFHPVTLGIRSGQAPEPATAPHVPSLLEAA
ncbi:MAG: phytoene/squalene synthase family protein [Myxococcota bacterium]|nr:phytoene/squalene synthase family protein [Myxococcota bacterium]